MYGSVSEVEPLAWAWVETELERAGTYWITPRGPGHPHPRPVWGVLADDGLWLTIGSPVVARQVAADPVVTVHLDSGTDVVIVEGTASLASAGASARHIDAYDAKYDWHYTLDEYGPFTHVRPALILAWRSGGWAGHDGFQQVGRWRVP